MPYNYAWVGLGSHSHVHVKSAHYMQNRTPNGPRYSPGRPFTPVNPQATTTPYEPRYTAGFHFTSVNPQATATSQRPTYPPGLTPVPVNLQATAVPGNAVLADPQPPPRICHTIIRTLATNTPPPGATIQVQQWCHALLGHPLNGGLFYVLIPVTPSYFDAFQETGIVVEDFKICGQLMVPVHHNFIFPDYDASTMRKKFDAKSGINAHIHWQDILGEREFVTRSDAATRRLRNEIAIAEVLDRPEYHHPNLARYLGVCLDPFQRVTCTAWTASMATLHDFVVSEDLLFDTVLEEIHSQVENGMKHMHHLGITHGAIVAKNVYLSWIWESVPTFDDGAIINKHFLRISEVMLENFDRAVDHQVNGLVSNETDRARRADESQLQELRSWMNCNMRRA
jgi:hypothetical protein